MRLFGWIERVEDTCVVATEFVHIGGLPLLPRATHLIDSTSLHTQREIDHKALRTELVEATSLRSIPLGRERRSIAAGYLRTWGVIAAMFGVAAATQWRGFIFLGGALLLLGVLVRARAFLERGDQLVQVGVGAIVGSFGATFGAMVVPRPVAGMIAATAIGGIAITLRWRWATHERAAYFGKLLGLPPEAIEQRRTLTERAARGSPAVPVAAARVVPAPSVPVAPRASNAPEAVEQATDTPHFLR